MQDVIPIMNGWQKKNSALFIFSPNQHFLLFSKMWFLCFTLFACLHFASIQECLASESYDFPYSLYVGAFTSKEDVDAIVYEFQVRGYTAFSISYHFDRWFKVFLGGFNTESEATKAGEAYKKSGLIGFVRPVKLQRHSKLASIKKETSSLVSEQPSGPKSQSTLPIVQKAKPIDTTHHSIKKNDSEPPLEMKSWKRTKSPKSQKSASIKKETSSLVSEQPSGPKSQSTLLIVQKAKPIDTTHHSIKKNDSEPPLEMKSWKRTKSPKSRPFNHMSRIETAVDNQSENNRAIVLAHGKTRPVNRNAIGYILSIKGNEAYAIDIGLSDGIRSGHFLYIYPQEIEKRENAGLSSKPIATLKVEKVTRQWVRGIVTSSNEQVRPYFAVSPLSVPPSLQIGRKKGLAGKTAQNIVIPKIRYMANQTFITKSKIFIDGELNAESEIRLMIYDVSEKGIAYASGKTELISNINGILGLPKQNSTSVVNKAILYPDRHMDFIERPGIKSKPTKYLKNAHYRGIAIKKGQEWEEKIVNETTTGGRTIISYYNTIYKFMGIEKLKNQQCAVMSITAKLEDIVIRSTSYISLEDGIEIKNISVSTTTLLDSSYNFSDSHTHKTISESFLLGPDSSKNSPSKNLN
jgi:hypothetical protein